MIICNADHRLSSDTQKASDNECTSRRDDRSDQRNAATETPNQSADCAVKSSMRMSVGIGCEFDKAAAVFILSKREEEVSKSEGGEV
jgi:hypothetical protein